MENKTSRAVLALGAALITETLMVGIFYGTGGEKGDATLNRLAVLFGGNLMKGGYIQLLEYVCFFWGMAEVVYLSRLNKKEYGYLDAEVLPMEEHAVINPRDVNQIRMKVSNYLQHKKDSHPNQNFYLLNMIKRVTTKFRNNQSVSEAMEIVTSQSQVNILKAESMQSFIRYTAWAVPTIGFIGTILGISEALAIADSGETSLITSTLGIAFDTTLVALVLSVILMWMIHNLQEQTENLHANVQEFITENLINRINTD